MSCFIFCNEVKYLSSWLHVFETLYEYMFILDGYQSAYAQFAFYQFLMQKLKYCHLFKFIKLSNFFIQIHECI